jgi:hypothetical protein
MPRIEREVDVWKNWATGALRNRFIDETAYGASFTPTYDEIREHIYQPWRYKFSMDEGKVSEHAYINIGKFLRTRGRDKRLLEWFDESHWNGDVARNPSDYLEVPKLDVTVNTHSKQPEHLPLLSTHVQPNFYRSQAITRDIDAFIARVQTFCLFISQVGREREPWRHEAQVMDELHALHEWLSSSSLLFLLQGTLAYLKECPTKPFEYVLDHFEDQIQEHMHDDLGTHWSQHAQAFDAHAREEEHLILLRDEAHVISKAKAFIKRVQYLVNRLVAYDAGVQPKYQKTISEDNVEQEVSELIYAAEANPGTGLHFPSTLHGLHALFDSLRASPFPLALVEVKRKFDELVGEAFADESSRFNSRLPR